MFNRIAEWNKDRRMDKLKADDSLVVYCIIEELFEYLGVPDTNCKKLAKQYSTYITEEALSFGTKATMEQKVDALCDINVFATGFILRHGYNPNMAMEQTLLEIESRQQNPSQKEEWDNGDFSNSKWIKDKNQSEETMYKARYNQCLNS